MRYATPHPLAPEPYLHHVLADYLDAEDAGSRPDRRRLLAAHPNLAPELARFFANYDYFEELLRPLRDRLLYPGS